MTIKEKADDGHSIVERTLAAGALARGTASEADRRLHSLLKLRRKVADPGFTGA